MPEQLTPEQLAVVLGTTPSSSSKKKQIPVSSTVDVFALAQGEQYNRRFDNEVLFYLDNSNRSAESRYLSGPAFPPIAGIGLWARVLSSVFLMNGEEGSSEVERYLSILKNTESGELKSRAVDALQGVVRFNSKIPAELMTRVEEALAKTFDPENQQFSVVEESL